MAWSLVNSASGTSEGDSANGDVTSHSPSFTSATAGNMLVLVGAIRSGEPNPISVSTSGWSIIVQGSVNSDTSSPRSFIIYKPVAAGGETSVTMTASTQGGWTWWYGEYSGLTSTPLDVSTKNDNSSSVTTGVTGATAATAEDDSLAIGLVAIYNTSSGEAVSSPFTSHAIVKLPGGGSVASPHTIAVGYDNIESASSTPEMTATWTTSRRYSGAIAVFKPAVTTVTGTAAWTEDADTAAASGTHGVAGSSAWTEAADTIAASGSTVAGTAAWTEAADTAAASGAHGVAGTSAWTEADDTIAASGTATPPTVTGTAAWTEADDSIAASGVHSITGTSSWTEEADTVAASGSTVTGTAAWTEAADTIVANGTFNASGPTGSAAWTEEADTVAASGVHGVAGTAAWTEADDTVAASGTVVATGTAAWTEDADTAAASGTHGVTGTAAWTEAADTIAASGTYSAGTVSGTAAWTEDDDTLAASGTATPPAITGTAAWTEADDTLAASGSSVSGTAAFSEGADRIRAIGIFTDRVGYLVMPSYESEPQASDDELRFQRITRGGKRVGVFFGTETAERSVLKIDGTYVTVTSPTTDQIAAATEVYLAGHVNYVTAAQSAALQSAGYTVAPS